MNPFYKAFVWIFMFSKRLLHQRSFVAILCLIPLILMMTKFSMNSESGALHIVLCNEDNTEMTVSIIEKLKQKGNIIKYSQTDCRKEAKELLLKREADAVWIFSENFEEKLKQYTKGVQKAPVIEIYERENTVVLNLAREILFGSLYDTFSYYTFENFIFSEVVDCNEFSIEKARDEYNKQKENGDVLILEKLQGGKAIKEESNYLIAPLRGLTSLVILLCSLAAAICFLKDKSEERFNWLPPEKRLIPAFAMCFSAAFLSGVAVFIAFKASGISTALFNEIISLLLYVAASAAFSMVMCVLVNSTQTLAALVPAIMITSTVLTPIFFNVKLLHPISLLLPTYYYLHSIYSSEYYIYLIIYSALLFALAIVMNNIFQRNSKRS